MNQWLLSLLLASTGSLAGTWLLALLLRKKSAAWRHFIWSMGFVAVLLSWTLMANSWRVELPWLGSSVSVDANREVAVEVSAISGDTNKPALVTKPVGKQIDWLLLLWLSGVVVCLSPLAVGWWRTRDLRKGAEVVGRDEELSRLAERIYAGMNSRCRWSILLSDETVMPLTGGWFKPFVILPAGAREWSELRLWRVFTHEIGHQVRRDFVWILFARIVCALCWFNPLAWYAAKRQRIEAEMACDDLVISAGDVAEDYADDLLQILRDFSQGLDTPFVSLMARQSQIKTRLQSMLSQVANRQPLGRFGKWSFVVSVLFLVSALATVRVVHAAGEKDQAKIEGASDKANKTDKGSDWDENYSIKISTKFIQLDKDASTLQAEGFKKALKEGDLDALMKMPVDLMSEPSVTVSVGQRCKIRSARELRYPTEWDFPIDAQEKKDPVPTKFVSKDVGLTIDCRSKWQGVNVVLDARVELTKFKGFVSRNGFKPVDGEMVVSETSTADGKKELVPIFNSVSSEMQVIGDMQEAVTATRLISGLDEDKNKLYGVLITAQLEKKVPTVSVAEKLDKIIIPKVDFVDADISEVLKYLQEQSKELDPQKQGVNIVFKDKPTKVDVDNPWKGDRKLILNLRNLSLKKILDFMQTLCSYKYKVENECVYVYPNTELAEVVLVRTYPTSPKLAEIIGPIEGDAMQDVKKQLVGKGIEFGIGCEAKYLPKSQKLVVRNVREELDKIERLLKE